MVNLTSQAVALAQRMAAEVKTLRTEIAARYLKPGGGIPKTDLAAAVQTSLGLADAAAPVASPTFTGTATTPALKITTGAAAGRYLRSVDSTGAAIWDTIRAFYSDTAANWATAYASSALAVGIAALETDTGKWKVGDGVNNWGALPYRGLQLGTTATTAAAGNHTHTPASIGAVKNESGASGLWMGTLASRPATGVTGVLYVTW